MGLFKRREKPAAASQIAVTIDEYLGDPGARALRQCLLARDWAAAQAILRQPTSPEQFGLLIAIAADTQGVETWIDTAVADDPDPTLPLLVKGTRYVRWAWEARGNGGVSSVGEDAWKVWFLRLKQAEDCLDNVVERDPGNIEAWHRLITLARARQLPKDDLWARYHKLVAIDPYHYYGNSQMLSALMGKWSGSHEEMFRFARERMEFGPGTMLPLLVAEAHVEFRDREGGDAYLERADIGDEIVAAAQQSLWHPDYRPTVQTRLLLNHFAHALAMADRFVEAERCFAQIGDDEVTPYPWGLYSMGGPKRFLQLRTYVRNRLS